MMGGDRTGDAPTLMVGVSNPDTADELVRLAATIRTAAPFDILLTHVVVVANQISLTTGSSSSEVVRARDFLSGVAAVARDDGIEAGGVVEVARSVEEGLLAAAESHGVAMILVGYSGREGAEEEPGKEEHFDRVMHRVARKAHSDVVVAKLRRVERQKIAVPLAVEAPLRLTGLLCRALAGGEGSELTFVHVGGSDADTESVRRDLTSRLSEAGLGDLGALDVRRGDDSVEAIVEAVSSYDLVVLGPSGRPGFLDNIFSGRARKIAEGVPGSVLLAWGSE